MRLPHALLLRFLHLFEWQRRCIERVVNTLMDNYARVGKLGEAEALFDSAENPDVVRYGVLIKAYGNCDRTDRATQVLLRLLKEPPRNSGVTPKVGLFTIRSTLDDAWAESSHEDAVEQAFAVVKLTEENDQ